MVADDVSPERTERDRGYDEGVLAQRLAQYDRHFDAINGSQAEAVVELRKLNAAVAAIEAAQVTASALAAAVAVALAQKESDGFTLRSKVAWGVGLVVSTLVIAGSVKALLGI